jgi:hypothetical protein
MSDRDRETWERFAAALVCGNYADPIAGALWNEWLVKAADRFLALTKERWPDEQLSGNPGQLPAKTCSPGCDPVTPAAAGDETVTAEPDPGEGYRWVEPGECVVPPDQCRYIGGNWLYAYQAHGCIAQSRWTYRTKRPPRADEPSETTPRADEVRSEVRIAEGGGVEELRSLETMLGPVVRRTDAERLLAASRREAEEARKECERLRLTDDERRLLSKYHRSEERAIEQFAVTSASYVADAKHATAVIGGLLARHDKGGAA